MNGQSKHVSYTLVLLLSGKFEEKLWHNCRLSSGLIQAFFWVGFSGWTKGGLRAIWTSCLSAIFTRILVDEWGNAENDDKENDHKKTSEKKTQRNIGKEKTKITSYKFNDEEWGEDGDDEEQVLNHNLPWYSISRAYALPKQGWTCLFGIEYVSFSPEHRSWTNADELDWIGRVCESFPGATWALFLMNQTSLVQGVVQSLL